MWGLNICVGQENKEGTDQGLDRLYVQDRRTGEGTDQMQDFMTKVWVEKEQKVRQGPGGDEWPG